MQQVLVKCGQCAFPVVERSGGKIKIRARLVYFEYGACSVLCKQCGTEIALPFVTLQPEEPAVPDRKFVVRKITQPPS